MVAPAVPYGSRHHGRLPGGHVPEDAYPALRAGLLSGLPAAASRKHRDGERMAAGRRPPPGPARRWRETRRGFLLLNWWSVAPTSLEVFANGAHAVKRDAYVQRRPRPAPPRAYSQRHGAPNPAPHLSAYPPLHGLHKEGRLPRFDAAMAKAYFDK